MYTDLQLLPTDGTKHLVVMLHGLGSNGEDLLSLAPFMAPKLPGVAFFSPNAIEPFDHGMGGYQWFGANKIREASFADYATNNCKLALGIIDQKIDALNLKRADTILLGFSQGGMIIPSIFSMDEGEDNFKAGILLCTRYAKPKVDISNKYNLCIIHGEEDELMSAEDAISLKTHLKIHATELEFHNLPHLGHSIDHRGIEIITKFIKKNFNI